MGFLHRSQDKNNLACLRLIALLLSLLLFLLSSGHLHAATAENNKSNRVASPIGAPFIHNFDAKLYKAHGQNWVAVQDQRGVMYFGNSNGILEFDGQRWQSVPTTGNPMVRSLAVADDGTIFYGSIGDFGYLRASSNGTVSAVSLRDKLPKDEAVFNDVWQVENTKQGVVFLTRSRIFRFHEGKLSAIAGRFASSQATVLNGTLIFADIDHGISLLNGDQIVPIPQLAKLFNRKRVMLAAFGNHEILAGRLSGDFQLINLEPLWNASTKSYDVTRDSPDLMQPLPTEIDSQLNENGKYLYKVLPIDADSFAISTVKAGIVILNRAGKVLRAINKNSGLMDNTVAGIMLDRAKNMWAATNSGISHIELTVPQTVFGAKNGLEGTSISVAFYQDRFYVGTFQDIFYQTPFQYNLKNDTPQFLPLRDSTSEIWQFLEVSGDLLAASGRGLYRIRGDVAEFIAGSSGNAYCLGATPLWPDHVFVGLMGGVEVFKRQDGAWHRVGRLDGINDNIRRITTDADGEMWLNTEVHGLLRAHFDGDKATQVKTHRLGLEHGLPDLMASRATRFGNDLFLNTPKGLFSAKKGAWQHPETDTTRFEPDPRFGKQFSDGTLEVYEVISDGAAGAYIKTSDGVFAARPQVKENSTTPTKYTIDGNPFRGLSTPDDVMFIHPSGGVWFPGELLLRVDPNAPKNYSQSFTTLIRKVTTTGKHLIFAGAHAETGKSVVQVATVFQTQQSKKDVLSLPYDQNALVFEFSAPFFEKLGSTRFQYQLEGFDQNWSEWDVATAKEYTNIPEGTYRFRVRAKNLYGVIGQEAIYGFEIQPPWYRSWWAYLVWATLTIFVVWSIAHFYSLRLKREKIHLEVLIAERTQQLREASLTDPLTGLRNRRFLSEVLHNDVEAFISYKNYLLQAAVSRNGMTGREVFALYLLDMDHFKSVNDTYGHEAGDHLLKQFSTILTDSVRKDDVVVRLGGEEFLVVLKNTKPDYIHTFAKKLLDQVAATEFDIGDGQHIRKTCSIGYSVFPFYAENPDLLSFEQSVMLSDMAMYYAKHHGRNQAVYFSETQHMPKDEEAVRHMTSSYEYANREGFIKVEQTNQQDC